MQIDQTCDKFGIYFRILRTGTYQTWNHKWNSVWLHYIPTRIPTLPGYSEHQCHHQMWERKSGCAIPLIPSFYRIEVRNWLAYPHIVTFSSEECGNSESTTLWTFSRGWINQTLHPPSKDVDNLDDHLSACMFDILPSCLWIGSTRLAAYICLYVTSRVLVIVLQQAQGSIVCQCHWLQAHQINDAGSSVHVTSSTYWWLENLKL